MLGKACQQVGGRVVWLGAAALVVCALPAAALDPAQRTADMPDSWLVLYNLNNCDSITWAIWYAQQRSIPYANLIGLDASTEEHLPDVDAVQMQIITPVRDLLEAGNPPRKDSIMGIILGYGLPGHYGTPPQNPAVGGICVADALQDMTDDDLTPGLMYYNGGQRGYNWDCPALSGYTLPPGGRLTRAGMAADRYMVARIDGPTLEDAKQLTLHALPLEDHHCSLFGESVWYDYTDPTSPLTNGEWYRLKEAVQAPELTELPWAEFDADTELISNDAFRFSAYRLTGWDDGWYASSAPGSRVLAYDLNSFGATTVRSTTTEDGRSVPNALAAGYAAAIGATGEPGPSSYAPLPKILLAGLQEGWTLGEAWYLCKIWDDWMWTLVGDPLLTLPNWFDEVIIDPSERTADLPDSWLVLYNLNDPDSVAWADWYRQERNIPNGHLLGLSASLDEHLPDLDAVQTQIITPVRDLLAGDPELEGSIMGIVLGYGLPGHYGAPLVTPGMGGFSVADALQDMFDDDLTPGLFGYEGGQRGYNWDCPTLYGWILPEEGRLTKANMTSNGYMVARIDAPSLAEVMALTQRAKMLEDPEYTLAGEAVWYDYCDPEFPSGNHEWYWLRNAVEKPELAELPWAAFEFETHETPQDAFRMAIYQLTGWSSMQFDCSSPGSRVLAFDYNDWGAVTVRSTSDQGGLFVPNALAAGYAAAIGASGKPVCCTGPVPEVVLAALQEGWTLGEAYHLSNPFNDWMWTLVGDPFLRLPNWFGLQEPMAGDINGDRMVNFQDLAGFRACLSVSGPGRTADPVCEPFDFDDDGDADLADFAGFQRVFTGGPVTPVTGDFDDDGDVDLVDLGSLTDCQAGVGPSTLGSGCAAFDSDFDLDVDLKDYGRFQNVFTGSGSLPHGD